MWQMDSRTMDVLASLASDDKNILEWITNEMVCEHLEKDSWLDWKPLWFTEKDIINLIFKNRLLKLGML